jgi:DNA-binding beta-propeller fold protein YncE
VAAEATPITVWGKPGTAPGEFNRAEGIAVDRQDRVYVADSCNHRIQVFDADGKFLRTYGHAGSGVGELSYPYDICVDAEGRQYVCEFGNSRIQVFDANDRPIEIIGGPGGAPGEFANPWAIALDSRGNLYVADAMNHRVQKLIRRAPAGQRAMADSQSSIANRSAELHSAVSQNCILRPPRTPGIAGEFARPAECNSAIQQIGNLRYTGAGDALAAMSESRTPHSALRAR